MLAKLTFSKSRGFDDYHPKQPNQTTCSKGKSILGNIQLFITFKSIRKFVWFDF